jgi:D-3-phosphoglycerate dehydrogenase
VASGSERQITVGLSVSSFGAAGEEPLERLRAAGARVLPNPHGRKLTADEVVELLADADGTIAGTEPLDAAVLERLPNLRAISRVGIGLDNVDLEAAERLGVRVFNTPDAVTDAAAELTVAGLLTLIRHVAFMDSELRAGRWTRQMGSLLRHKTVGIVGLGRIGRRVARLLSGFEPELLGYDPVADADHASEAGVRLVPLDELLAASHVVTLHATASATLVGKRELDLMRPGTLLVNVARGGLVDEDALHSALANEQLGGAYLDVFAEEPYEGPLSELGNVVLTPHAGSFAREARALMETEAVENLLGFLQQ